jgi:hypothetical protein
MQWLWKERRTEVGSVLQSADKLSLQQTVYLARREAEAVSEVLSGKLEEKRWCECNGHKRFLR